MSSVDASKFGTVKQGVEVSKAPPPKSPTSSKPGHGTGRKA